MKPTTEIEEGVLGAVLLDPTCLSLIYDRFKPSRFIDPRNRAICEAILTLYQENSPIDLITVHNKVKEVPTSYIASLTNRIASTVNVEKWALILAEYHLRREILQLSVNIGSKAQDESGDVVDLYTETLSRLESIYNDTAQNVPLHIAKRNPEVIKAVINRGTAGDSLIKTGLNSVDHITGGYMPGDLVYLAGRPGMGKTAMLLNQALHIAENHGPIVIFSLEMAAPQLIYRLNSQLSGLNTQHLLKNKLNPHEFSLYAAANEKLDKLPIFIDDSAALTVHDIRARTLQLKAKHGIKAVFIDYIQLIHPGKKSKETRDQELSQISRQLKQLSKEAACPVISLSQLSRGVESRSDKRPLLSDLRESGSLEQDADSVIFLFRPDYYGHAVDDRGKSVAGICEYIIAKQRNGRTGIAEVSFKAETMQFTDYADPF
ncbi:MAG: replicative DNA helicase [Caulobacteraceae bacterium]|nr:replicative DNA helicase [Caulobacteraceae bacterium]